MELFYFKSIDELREVIRQILQRIGAKLGGATIAPSTGPLTEMFSNIFEDKSSGKLALDKVQVICPTRVGDFGTMAINIRVIRDNDANFTPRTKLICEKNIYIYTDAVDKNGRRQRILALANGSIGYIKSDGCVYFEDLEDLKTKVDTRPIENKIIGDFAALETDRDIDFGYAITVRKSQGSDFDYVIFVLPEVTPFVTKELLYTAFTRPKEELYFVVHSSLKEELPPRLCQAYENSSTESRKTLVFEYKASPLRPYVVTLRSGKTIEARSKVKYIMAKALDDAGVEFEYEPREFFEEYHIVPDFKIFIDGEAYYIEHLGNMNNPSYRNRWFQKFEVYKKLGLVDKLITTSESEERSDIEGNVKKIVEDIKSKCVKRTEGSYPLHHYYI